MTYEVKRIYSIQFKFLLILLILIKSRFIYKSNAILAVNSKINIFMISSIRKIITSKLPF